MQNYKYIFIILLSFLIVAPASSLFSKWMIWQSVDFSGDVNKHAKLEFSIENRFTFDTKLWELSMFDPVLWLKIKKENYIGFDPEYQFYRTSPTQITREFTPIIYIKNSFKLVNLDARSLVSLY